VPSTTIDLTSVAVAVLTSATIWANTRGASVSDPVAFAAFNQSAIPVRVTANSAATTASGAMPILSSGYLSRDFTRKSIGLFAFTSNSTATIVVETDR
jgi:hypothetical protein